jgi:hypothetical protein
VQYHRERNHQGLGNELIDRSTGQRPIGPVRRRGESAGSSATTIGRLRSAAAIQSWDRTASTELFGWVSAISAGLHASSWPTITGSGITKGCRTA